MILKHIQTGLINRFWLTLLISFCGFNSFSQPGLPQRTITVNPTQALSFGRFCVAGAGTITVGYDGSRSSTGGIALISTPSPQPAIFEIKLCSGRQVSISFDASSVPLNGTNGGTLTLNLGPTEKGGNGVTFSTNNDCNFITPLRVGGTLIVPGGVPAGSYAGSFSITFIQQ